MAKTPGLVIKGGAYYYRRAVPEPLRPEFQNKKELWITLKAEDRRQASEQARAAAADADKQLRAARERLAGKLTSAGSVSVVADASLQRVAKAHLHRLEAATIGWPEQEERGALDIELGDLLAGYEMAPQVLGIAIRLASEHDLRVQLPINPSLPRMAEIATSCNDGPGSGAKPVAARGQPVATELVRLVELVRRAEIEHVRRRLDRLEGDGGDKPHDPLFADVSTLTPPPTKARASATLGEAIKRFETDPTRADLSQAAAMKYVLPFRALREVVGDDRPLVGIERADCVEAFELLAAIPANIKKKARYDGLTLKEIVALAKETKDERLSATTVRNHAHHISSFFNWAIRKGLISANPATRMTDGSRGAASTRKPFSLAQLNSMFAALPQWAEGQPGRHWLPLIALFSGMRLGEIAMLTADDVKTVDGATCFVLAETDERRLKTPGATRTVPIHPELVRLGLLAHVEGVSKAGGGRLFADLARDDQRQTVDVFQKRFSYFLSKLDGFGGVSFHSFRHNFRDALREAGSPIDVTRALGGWARSGGLEERYGQGTRASTLAKWMANVRYDGLKVAQLE